MSSLEQHGFNSLPQDARIHEAIAEAYEASLGRLASSRYHTAESVAWAAEQLRNLPEKVLDVDGAPSRRIATARLRHLSAQRAALDKAYETLAARSSEGADDLHQSYCEWLTGLARNDRWMTEDDGIPSVAAALRSLRRRSDQRRIDRVRCMTRASCWSPRTPTPRSSLPTTCRRAHWRTLSSTPSCAPGLATRSVEEVGSLPGLGGRRYPAGAACGDARHAARGAAAGNRALQEATRLHPGAAPSRLDLGPVTTLSPARPVSSRRPSRLTT